MLSRTYVLFLHGLPSHGSTSATEQTKMLDSSAIPHGETSLLILLIVMRAEVSVAPHRYVFYRTWYFRDNFQTNPAYYLNVTHGIEPHVKFAFSIKHQKGDFYQFTPFNPTLTIGKHRQVVQMQ